LHGAHDNTVQRSNQGQPLFAWSLHKWSTLDEYFKHFERTKSAINLGTFVGAGGVRNYVMGTVNRPASPAELEQMRHSRPTFQEYRRHTKKMRRHRENSGLRRANL